MSLERQEDFWLELALMKERYLKSFQEHVASPVRNDLLRIEARLKKERELVSAKPDEAAAIDRELAVVRKAVHLLESEVVRLHGMTLRDADAGSRP
jgi:hypothetical protein